MNDLHDVGEAAAMNDLGTVGLAWRQAVGVLGGRDEAAVSSGSQLDRIYQDHARSYHGTAHICQVIADVATLGADCGLDPIELAAATAAACAHDVVYTGNSGADEAASASWAQQALISAKIERRHQARVSELILLTTDHVAEPGDVAAWVLIDADLAVLGGEPRAYAEYLAAVRREYQHVSDADWAHGRGAVLDGLLGRGSIYHLDAARRRWERSARENVEAELRSLSGSAG